MLDTELGSPPADVIAALDAAGLTSAAPGWTRLRGGRTNRLWSFASGTGALVCKLYAPEAATPLFPNDPDAEARALTLLADSGLAPRLRRTLTCDSGRVLVYDHVPATRPHDPIATVKALARLHGHKPPSGLRRAAADPTALLAQGDIMMRGISGGSKLENLRPEAPVTPRFEYVLLHGDPVPANILQTAAGPCFIDWQCPAIGDPTEDLALYLSPAMQHLYGGQPLGPGQIDAVLAAYGNPDSAARYRALAPLYHWRMAAYCLWKTQAGDADYAQAADLEIAMLKQINQRNHRHSQASAQNQQAKR